MEKYHLNSKKVTLNLPKRYQYLEDIGYGIYSQVYRVYDGELEREVALKLISNHESQVNEEVLCRYKELDHPNILKVYDSQVSDKGMEYITMQYIPEGNIEQYANFFSFGINIKVNQLVQVAQGIKCLHKNNLVHGNVSLSNMFYDISKQKSYLSDMKFYTITSPVAFNASNVRARNNSLHYKAPESFEKESVQGDIYSFGVCLYKLLTSKFPYISLGGRIYTDTYVSQYINELRSCSESAVHPSIENDLVDIRLGDICMKAIAKNKEHRYQEMSEVIDELNDYIDHKSSKKIITSNQTQTLPAVDSKRIKRNVCLLKNKGINEYAEGVQWLRAEEPLDTEYRYEFKKYSYDPAYARYLFQVAVHKGYTSAFNQLGIIYEYGLGVRKDEKRSYDYYLQSATRGNIEGLTYLGICYLDGKGVAKDKKLALKYFTLAAAQSDAKAYLHLGQMYESDGESFKDDKKAVEFYQKSARLGNGKASRILGLLSQEGKKLDKDLEKAEYYFKHAIELEDDYAYYHLGKLYTENSRDDNQYKMGIKYLEIASQKYNIEDASSLLSKVT